jgi:hypothetical protein
VEKTSLTAKKPEGNEKNPNCPKMKENPNCATISHDVPCILPSRFLPATAAMVRLSIWNTALRSFRRASSASAGAVVVCCLWCALCVWVAR